MFSILVGMQHDEIIDRKINGFMPELYAMFHDNFMRNYLQREEDNGGFLNADNSLFIKNNSGYIMLLYIKIKVIETLQGTQFLGTFRTENVRKLYTYFICRNDGLITDISASAITILNLNLLLVRKTNMNIDSIVPNALKERKYQEGGKEFPYELKDYEGNSTGSIRLLAIVTLIDLRDRTNKEFIILAKGLTGLSHAGTVKEHTPYTPTTPGHEGDSWTYGYIVRIEKIEKISQRTKQSSDINRFKSRTNRGTGSLNDKSFEESNSPVRNMTKRDSVQDAGSHLLGKEKEDVWIYGFRTDKDDLEIGKQIQLITHLIVII